MKGSSKGFRGWRLFQGVFIVSVLTDLVSRDHTEIKHSRDRVDLLFYPTGGGKTEAFLGLAIFQAFFDRIHGKTCGTTALAKFPLRMLSIQQLQRIADAFASAELVRRKNAQLMTSDSEPFSIGYYVGKNNTPNELEGYDQATRRYTVSSLEEWEADPEKAQRFLVVSRCPFCHADGVSIRADSKKIRLYHWCSKTGCPSGGPLPIYISDSEIYRYLPTFIVSTLDKMVICGYQRKFRNILGQVLYKCPLHGLTSEPRCVVGSCEIESRELEPFTIKNGLPSLMIQDELHLVRENLGCLASHYETFFEHLILSLGFDRDAIKIIGATATASNFEDHIWHLYLKSAIKFPSNLDIYSEKTPQLARITIGVMPHGGRTAIFVMEQVLICIKSELERLSNLTPDEANRVFQGESPDAIKKELEDFRTTLSYHIRRADAEQLNRSVWSRINPSLSKDNFATIKPANLTGDVGFDRVRKVMARIEGNPKEADRIDLLTATNLISHGVDIDKLNVMVFMGMPGNNAEYLQAKSRVARRNAGLVVVVFIPGRERDHSFFRYFQKFHELNDLLIEPVPVNRWAPLALARTSPGIFCAAIYNFFDLSVVRSGKKPIWKVDGLRNAISNKIVSQEEMMRFILESYGSQELSGSARDDVERILTEKVESYMNKVLTTTDQRWLPIASVVEPRPLISLRDIGAGVSIELSHESQSIVDRFKKLNAEYSEEYA